MGVTEFYYLEGGLLFGFLVAAGLTVIGLQRPAFKVARRCAWASTFLFASIAIVWGITTPETTWIRISAVGIAGLVAAVVLSETLRFIAQRENLVSSEGSHTPAAARSPLTPTLEAHSGGTIDASGATIPGDLPFQFGHVDTGGELVMRGMTVTRQPNGIINVSPGQPPSQFPAPTGEFSALSNAELRNRVAALSANLRVFQAKFDVDFEKLAREKENGANISQAEFDAFRAPYRKEWDTKYAGLALSLACEILARVSSVAPTTSTQIDGGTTVYEKSFAGSTAASDAAVFLDLLASHLPAS